MHNLFLGSGKHILKDVWIEKGIIAEVQFTIILNRVDKVVSPPDVGRIPNKIRSGFASFTADQFKNWIIYFSVLALHDILVGDHFECWRHFVLACRYLCKSNITYNELKLADALLMHFCKRSPLICICMHTCVNVCKITAHLMCMFWLFSFERYNGILENLPNNNRAVEIQLMRRFVENTYTISTPDDFSNDFSSLFKEKRTVGTLHGKLTHPPILSERGLLILCDMRFPSFLKVECLVKMILMLKLFSVPVTAIETPYSYLKYQHVLIDGKIVGSKKSRSSSSSILMAQRYPTNQERPCQVYCYASHKPTISSIATTILLFYATWFKSHRDLNLYGKPVSI